MKKARKSIISIISIVVLMVSFTIPALAYGSITNHKNIYEVEQKNSELNEQDFGSSAVLYVNGDAKVVATKDKDHIIWVTASGFDGTLNKEIDFPLTLEMYWSTGQSNKGFISTLEVLGNGRMIITDPEGNNLHVRVGKTITIVPDAPTTPEPDPDPDPDPIPCECKLSYAIAKNVYYDEDCTELATVVEAGDTVWYKVVVTVSIIDNGCESDECIGLPEKVTIYDDCMANGSVEVSVGEDGKAVAVYSFEVEEFDEEGKFINVAYIMVGNDKISDKATVTKKAPAPGVNPYTPPYTPPQTSIVVVVEEFEDITPPLVQAPVLPPVYEPEPEPDVEIAEFEFEEEIPLSQMPQTGVNDVIILMACGFLGAAVLLTAAAVTINKMKKNDNIA